MKKTSYVNPHVVVVPEDDYDGLIFFGTALTREKHNLRKAEKLMAEIKRHVDGIADISVEMEEENVCSFCGSTWTEDSATYNGGCCDEDDAGNPANAEA